MSVFNEKSFDAVFESACDFFTYSNQLHSENINISLVCFATSLELFLKLRLFKEHWSLIIKDMEKFDKEKAEQGDFLSVNANEIMARIKNCNLDCAYEAISDREQNIYNDIFKYRNRAVHFYNIEADKDKTKKCMITAWYHMYKRLAGPWKALFDENQLKRIDDIHLSLVWHKEYAKKVYHDKENYIKEKQQQDYIVRSCGVCKQKSFLGALQHSEKKIISFIDMECCVCNVTDQEICFICPQCSYHAIIDRMRSMSACPGCERKLPFEDQYWCFGCSEKNLIRVDDKFFCTKCWIDFDSSEGTEKCAKCEKTFVPYCPEEIGGEKYCEACFDQTKKSGRHFAIKE